MSEPFIGQIQAFGFNFAPRGWALCQGQLLSISQYTALFSLLGTTYGGDGRTTFGLPDLRGRIPLGVGNGPGLSNYAWGQKGGVEEVTVGASNLPSIASNPAVAVSANSGTTDVAAGKILARPIDSDGEAVAAYADAGGGGNLGGVSSTVTGGSNQPLSNLSPYIVVYYSIALVGLFPSRN